MSHISVRTLGTVAIEVCWRSVSSRRAGASQSEFWSIEYVHACLRSTSRYLLS